MANCALSRTVPVVGSIWLSTVRSVPEDSLRRISRSKASTGSRSPRRSLSSTAGRLSSASVNSTAIGCTSVITTRPVVSLACTMLPGSTSRRPMRPPIGAVIRQYASCSFALSIAAWSDLTTPSSWRTSAAWVSTCWVAIESWEASTRKRSRSRRAFFSSASSRAIWPSACSSMTWNGRGSICASRSPAATVCPSRNCTLMSWPSTRLFTVTLWKAVTEPRPFR